MREKICFDGFTIGNGYLEGNIFYTMQIPCRPYRGTCPDAWLVQYAISIAKKVSNSNRVIDLRLMKSQFFHLVDIFISNMRGLQEGG